MTDETLFLSTLPVINDVVSLVCRRHRLSAAEAEDFAGEVRLHFIQRNYEALRKFEGRCTLRTYVTVLVQHCFHDYRNRLWGKWRPSAEAKRLGPTAVLLERLVIRDGWTVEQAADILKTNHRVVIDAALAALCVKMAQRQPPRQMVAEREAEAIESGAPAPDANVVDAEQDFRARRVVALLDRARQALPAEERLIVKMRFEDGVSVADIARALQLNQKRLYRTIEQILAKLRRSLEAAGLSTDDLRALFEEGALGAIDRDDDDDSGGGAGSAPAPATQPRRPWLQTR